MCVVVCVYAVCVCVCMDWGGVVRHEDDSLPTPCTTTHQNAQPHTNPCPAYCTPQINTIATALGAPSKASTAAVRTLLQATAHDGWRSLPTASQVHATVDMLRTTLGYSLHTIAKMATAQSNLLCTPVRTLTRHYEYLAGTLAGVSAPTTTRKASTRAGQHPNTSANHVKLLHTAIRRNPALLVLDDLSMRRAWLRGVLTTRCDLSGDAVASQVLVGCPEALALSRARVQGVVAVLVRVLGATRAGELLTLAPRILCMRYGLVVHAVHPDGRTHPYTF